MQHLWSVTVLLAALAVSVASIVCLAATAAPTQSRSTQFPMKPVQSPPTELNTCKCEPPIRSQATATGSCTRTQDDGTFCDLKFSLGQNASAAIHAPDFDRFAASYANVSKKEFAWFASRADDRYELTKTDDAARVVKAAATLAAFGHRQDERTLQHLQDVLSMLTFEPAAAEARKQPVWRSLERFGSNEGSSPQFEKIFLDNQTYELITTPGCMNFSQEKFTFMLKTAGSAPPCDRPQ